MTPPTHPLPETWPAADKAMARFAVQGNAISEYILHTPHQPAKQAKVTGGGGTLAAHAARALLEHGLAGLALLDVIDSQAEHTASVLQRDFPRANIIWTSADVTAGIEVVEHTFAMAARQLGSIDILVCFAGIVGCTHALDMSEQEWRRTLDVNTTGGFLCAQAAARLMRAQRMGGSIVLIASISGHRVNFPQPQVAYNVSKTALLHMARSLAAEWAKYGIRVNTISPGYMDTILNEGEGLARARGKWAERNPMGRMGTPAELTGPLVLLCSKFAGAYINGTDLVVDGGGIVF